MTLTSVRRASRRGHHPPNPGLGGPIGHPRPVTEPPATARSSHPAAPASTSSLDPELLGQITAGLARTPAMWESSLTFDEVGITHQLLLPSQRYDVWVEGWSPRADRTTSESSGGHQAITVVAGALVHTEVVDGQRHARILPAGETIVLSAGTSFGLANHGPSAAVSIRAIERQEVGR